MGYGVVLEGLIKQVRRVWGGLWGCAGGESPAIGFVLDGRCSAPCWVGNRVLWAELGNIP